MSDSKTDMIIISGLPRSGTSMMMGFLKAGGLKLYIDGYRKADQDNPKGYFEFNKVKNLKNDNSWVEEARGKALKVISHLLYFLPSTYTYKVIFMCRDLSEVCQSQQKMLKNRNLIADTVSDKEMYAAFEKHVTACRQWIEAQPNMAVLYIDFRNTIEKPAETAEKVEHFLEKPLCKDIMIKTVVPNLYRNKNTLAGI